jgi:Polyketide cyclase / dehydrase and lipid transport
MTKYDVVNEATIAATPAEIVGAFLDEAAGRSQWWQPSLRMRQRGGKPLPEIGAAVDITVNGEGLFGQRWGAARFAARVTAFDPDRRLVLRYFDGDFRGTEEWTLDPVDAGHTRIATRWRTDPQGAVRLAARFVDVPGSYSKVMREGFRAIERFTAGRRTESQA